MYDRRVQLLLDEERYRRVERIARQRGTSVASVIREAIDRGLPGREARRTAAVEALLGADPIDVGTPEELRAELDRLRDRPL